MSRVGFSARRNALQEILASVFAIHSCECSSQPLSLALSLTQTQRLDHGNGVKLSRKPELSMKSNL